MITLDEARQQFVQYLQGRSRASATILAYGKDIEQLVSYLSKAPLNKVTPDTVSLEDLTSFMKQLVKEGYTTKSVSRKTNSTKTFFKFLRQTGVLSDNPADSLEHPKFENKPPRVLTEIEYRALRDAAKADVRISAIIELFLQTGIRVGELANLTVSDLNLTDPSPTLSVHASQDSAARNIPLNKPAVSAIQRYLELRPKSPNKALFITKTGRPLLIRNIRTAIDRYFKMAGIQGAKVNDLRHTWIAHHLASGTSLTLISKLAGHKRVSTTERYLQFIQGKSAVEAKVSLEEL